MTPEQPCQRRGATFARLRMEAQLYSLRALATRLTGKYWAAPYAYSLLPRSRSGVRCGVGAFAPAPAAHVLASRSWCGPGTFLLCGFLAVVSRPLLAHCFSLCDLRLFVMKRMLFPVNKWMLLSRASSLHRYHSLINPPPLLSLNVFSPVSSRRPHGRGPAAEFKPARPTRSETLSLLSLELLPAHALLARLSRCPPSTHWYSHFSRSSSCNVSSPVTCHTQGLSFHFNRFLRTYIFTCTSSHLPCPCQQTHAKSASLGENRRRPPSPRPDGPPCPRLSLIALSTDCERL